MKLQKAGQNMHFEVFSFKQWLLSHANMTEALLV
jgi:hypothetical protein